MAEASVTIIGGGPAGCVAGLTLNRLGHRVTIVEKERFPRYRVGESLLPGTLSILSRLGIQRSVEAAAFVRKPSATFLWGEDQSPWTFSFKTPRTAPWVFDHAVQVERDEFDRLLVEEAKARGVAVWDDTEVTHVDISDPDRAGLTVRRDGSSWAVESDFVIDAAGSASPLARKLKVRRYDELFKNFAIWSYFRKSDPFDGDLKGTTYSITFEDGWVWMIPLKNDIYSVGLVVDRSKAREIPKVGLERVYRDTLAKCSGAMEILGDARPVGEVRIVKDWSYDSTLFSADRFFLCGDSACFTDPMFAQGVHLGAQAAVCAAAAIDRVTQNPDELVGVHSWYNRSYRQTYEQYHEFLVSFYTLASLTEPHSDFWLKRRLTHPKDPRLEGKQWFEKYSRSPVEESHWSLEAFRDRALSMVEVGTHRRPELSDEFSDDELNDARVRWIGELTKQLNRISELRWIGDRVLLRPYYRVEPQSFRLERVQVLANEDGLDMVRYPMEERHREIFQSLCKEPMSYRRLIRELGDAGMQDLSSKIVLELMEVGLLTAHDNRGNRIFVQDRLHFDGVGAEYGV